MVLYLGWLLWLGISPSFTLSIVNSHEWIYHMIFFLSRSSVGERCNRDLLYAWLLQVKGNMETLVAWIYGYSINRDIELVQWDKWGLVLHAHRLVHLKLLHIFLLNSCGREDLLIREVGATEAFVLVIARIRVREKPLISLALWVVQGESVAWEARLHHRRHHRVINRWGFELAMGDTFDIEVRRHLLG